MPDTAVVLSGRLSIRERTKLMLDTVEPLYRRGARPDERKRRSPRRQAALGNTLYLPAGDSAIGMVQ